MRSMRVAQNSGWLKVAVDDNDMYNNIHFKMCYNTICFFNTIYLRFKRS